MQLRRRILKRCRSLEVVTFRDIITEESRGYPREIKRRCRLGKMRSAMQRARYSVLPPPPLTLRQLTDILQDPHYTVLTNTDDGQDNIYAASVTDTQGSHHIIFMSQRMARVMKRLSILFGDGTFLTLPVLEDLDAASQIFAIVGNWDHTIVPLAWVLMQRQTVPAYRAVFRALKALVGDFPHLSKFISDFEAAIRVSVTAEFPGITMQGCFFHLVRAMIKYVKNTLRLHRLLQRHPYKRFVKLCCALPLLPLRYIRRGFELIVQEARQFGPGIYRRIRPFFAYVMRQWVGHPIRRRWICVFGSEHRTNNTCESHNRMLKNFVKVAHPSVYQFISALISVESNADADASALSQGERPNRRRRFSSVMLDRRLRNLMRQIRNPPDNVDNAIMRYLDNALHTFDNAYDRAVEEV
ncbi:DNA excision repair protein ERCC-6-like 2 [Frankliniella fusca]|uniref:DNA excision repair protein ERCC-6-like 2 n=1 Tax=Frankliniella fusca TaxID=407009 RepID=A0AAE1LK22_9NEOP|nr:DNA excision repair protein ERCC-6-like 2 [Frankliniella fusca]